MGRDERKPYIFKAYSLPEALEHPSAANSGCPRPRTGLPQPHVDAPIIRDIPAAPKPKVTLEPSGHLGTPRAPEVYIVSIHDNAEAIALWGESRQTVYLEEA